MYYIYIYNLKSIYLYNILIVIKTFIKNKILKLILKLLLYNIIYFFLFCYLFKTILLSYNNNVLNNFLDNKIEFKTISNINDYIDLNSIKKYFFSTEKNIFLNINKQYIINNNIIIFLDYAIYVDKKNNSNIYINKNDFYNIIYPLFCIKSYNFGIINLDILFKYYFEYYLINKRKIIIDPGHGGNDTGAINKKYNIKEKDINLKISLILKKLLIKEGYDVILTRYNDKNLSLNYRINFILNNNPYIIISIHCNSINLKYKNNFLNNSNINGIETYIYSNKKDNINNKNNKLIINTNQLNTLLSYCIHSELIKNLNAKDRGIKRSNFLILKNLFYKNKPSILLELGFITNELEIKKLINYNYQYKIAKSIFIGIKKYNYINYKL